MRLRGALSLGAVAPHGMACVSWGWGESAAKAVHCAMPRAVAGEYGSMLIASDGRTSGNKPSHSISRTEI